MEKIKIQIPVVGLSKSQVEQQLKQIRSEYEDEFIFEASIDEEYHIEKIDSKEDISFFEHFLCFIYTCRIIIIKKFQI